MRRACGVRCGRVLLLLDRAVALGLGLGAIYVSLCVRPYVDCSRRRSRLVVVDAVYHVAEVEDHSLLRFVAGLCARIVLQ